MNHDSSRLFDHTPHSHILLYNCVTGKKKAWKRTNPVIKKKK